MRENLSVDTSFDAFIYSANAIFSSLVTVLTLKWREIKEEQDNFSLLNQVRTVVFTLQDGLLTRIISNAMTFWLKYTLAVFP